jgi:hypothetical protein
MGRSIVRNPKVFLFDEPLSNLDAKLRVQMRTEIKALHQKLGTTIVYVTHDQIEAMTMADRIVVMNAGHIEQIGSPLELYDKPANVFVASFIGSPAMSFISGTYHPRDIGAVVELADGALLPVHPVSAPDGAAVEVGIRPENYLFTDNGPLQLVVEVVEPTGPETHVFGRMAGKEVRCVFRIRLDPALGSTLQLGAAPDHIHLFDATSGSEAHEREQRTAVRRSDATIVDDGRRIDIIARLRSRLGKGHRAEAQLIECILADLHFATTAAIGEIARRAQVSEPTVTRLARSLGFHNTRDMKVHLAQALATGGAYLRAHESNSEGQHSSNQVVATICGRAHAALDLMSVALAQLDLTALGELIAGASRVICYGTGGNSSMAAAELQNRLFRLGLNSNAYADPQLQSMSASVVDGRSVIVAFSTSGRARVGARGGGCRPPV